MKSYLPFYWKQSVLNLKKDWITILFISLSLSMFAGLSYFHNTTIENNFKSSFTNFNDFSIIHYGTIIPEREILPEINLNFGPEFQLYHDDIMNTLNESDLEILNICEFGIVDFEEGLFCRENFTDVDPGDFSSIYSYIHAINSSTIHFSLFDENFYNSSRFNEYFKIIQGEAPKNKNEFLIDYSFAKKYSYNIGDSINISVVFGRIFGITTIMTDLKEFPIENVSISGIYLSTKNKINLNERVFDYSYIYSDYINNRTYQTEEFLDSPLTFCYYNLLENTLDHPLQIFKNNLKNDNEYKKYLRSVVISTGYLMMFDRKNIDFSRLRYYKTSISQQAQSFGLKLPVNVGFVDFLGYQLNNIYDQNKSSRYLIQILNIPFILFALFISSNLIKSKHNSDKNKQKSLRGRGIPANVIKKQMYFNAIFNGIIASIFGLILGLFTFIGFRNWLSDLLKNPSTVNNLPNIAYNTIYFTFFLGVLINVIASIPTIKKVQNSKYSQLASELHNIKNFVEDTEFNRGVIKKKNKSKKIHEIPTPKISKKTIILLTAGLIPILFYLIIFIGIKYPMSDNIIDISHFLKNNLVLLQFLNIFGASMFVIGIINIFMVERPFLYFYLSKFFSKIFVKDLNNLVVIELIREKQWSKIAKYLAIFTSLLLITNISFNSQYRYEQLEENIYIGADLTVNLNEISHQNITKINSLETSLMDLEYRENEKIINNLATCYIDDNASTLITSFGKISSVKTALYSMNMSKYLKIISEDNKPFPYPNFDNQIEKLINSDDSPNSENLAKPIFVSSCFLSEIYKEIGDKFMLNHNYYDIENEEINQEQILVQIIGIIDLMPGIFFNSNTINSNLNSIIIDINQFDNLDSKIHGIKIIQLFDINENFVENSSFILSQINPELNKISSLNSFNFYNQNWDKEEEAIISFNLGGSGFYKLLSLDMIMLGIFIALELSMMMFLITKKNSWLLKNLLGRGISKKKFLLLYTAKILNIFIFSVIIGALIGYTYAFIQNKVNFLVFINTVENKVPSYLNFPIYVSTMDFLNVLILGFLITLTTYLFLYSKFIKKNRISKPVQKLKTIKNIGREHN